MNMAANVSSRVLYKAWLNCWPALLPPLPSSRGAGTEAAAEAHGTFACRRMAPAKIESAF